MLNETGWSVIQYLTEFRARRERYLAEGRPVDYPATVVTTWSVAFDRLSPAARNALDRAACLDPRYIPARWVTTGLDALDASRAIVELSRHGLITDRTDTSFGIHRLVQVVTRSRPGFDLITVLEVLTLVLTTEMPDVADAGLLEDPSLLWWAGAGAHLAQIATHIANASLEHGRPTEANSLAVEARRLAILMAEAVYGREHPRTRYLRGLLNSES